MPQQNQVETPTRRQSGCRGTVTAVRRIEVVERGRVKRHIRKAQSERVGHLSQLAESVLGGHLADVRSIWVRTATS